MASKAIEEAVSNPRYQLHLSDRVPRPNRRPTGYNFQGRSTAFKTGPMNFIKIPPPCISPCPGAGASPLSTRLLVLIAVRRKKMLMTAIRNRKTADMAVPTVPPISPTADHQLTSTVVDLAYHRAYRISGQRLLWRCLLLSQW